MSEIHHLVVTHGRDQARTMVEPEDRPLIDIAARILAEDSGEIELTYSGFALISLPHKDPKSPAWERRNGRCSLLLQAGQVYERGKWVEVGLPFGSRARLLMLYIQTEALRTDSPSVALGKSLHSWMERMGIYGGGTDYTAVREQARRISGCRLSFGWSSENGEDSGFRHAAIVQGAMFVGEKDGRTTQGSLFDERCELSDQFFQALKRHPVPLWAPAIREISSSSAVIDIYIWLAYRLHALKKPTLVPWVSLYEQFGTGYSLIRKWRGRFLPAVKEALAVYPDANVEVTKDGLLLRPSRPPIPAKVHQILLPTPARRFGI